MEGGREGEGGMREKMGEWGEGTAVVCVVSVDCCC